MVCTQSKSSDASAELDYVADMTEFLRSSTDMLIVVEGTELPCHKQVMAVHSKVFAGMADLTARLGHGAPVSAKICSCVARIPLASRSSRKDPCMRACLTLMSLRICRVSAAHGGAFQGQAARRHASPHARRLQVHQQPLPL